MCIFCIPTDYVEKDGFKMYFAFCFHFVLVYGRGKNKRILCALQKLYKETLNIGYVFP